MTRLFSLVVVTLASLVIGTSAQTPQTQPRVQAGDVIYMCSIFAPPEVGSGANGMAVQGNRWFYGTTRGIVELTLPTCGGTAKVVRAPQGLPNITTIHPTGDVHTGGFLPLTATTRLVSAFAYYDGSGWAKLSHYTYDDATGFTGPYAVATPLMSTLDPAWTQNRAGMVGGYMGTIPPEWQILFGGTALTGNCCIPIIWRSSFGPSVSVFNPGDVGRVDPVPSTMLVGYPNEHKTLGDYVDGYVGQWYTGTNQIGSVAFPAGTRSVLFTGRFGQTMCYGPGTPDKTLVGKPAGGGSAYLWCYDPWSADQGAHGPPYDPTMWAYDANDLLEVKQGTKKPWDVLPYAKWKLPNWTDGPNEMRAGYYDQQTGRYYVGMTNDRETRIYTVTAGGQPVPTTATITVDPAVTHQTMRGWEISGEMNQLHPSYLSFQGAALDAVLDAGINRVTLGVRSGSEHPNDAYGVWAASGFVFGSPEHAAWRASRYTTINDDGNPASATAGRFHWTEIDTTVDRIINPLRAKAAARGITLHVGLVYIAFYGGQTEPNVHQTPAEYAEFITEAFTHLHARNGWVPDSIDTVLEPDNTVNWNGTLLGQTIAAAGVRLAAAGFTPSFSAPSTTNMTSAPAWFDDLWAVTAARPFIKELSYHRYHGVSTTALQDIASKAQAAGISTAMLEWWDDANGHETLHEDLTVGRNSAWQQSEIVDVVGAGVSSFAVSTINLAAPTVATLTTRTRFLSHYYLAARIGSVRIGASSSLPALAPLAFRNPDGRMGVVVKASGAVAAFGIGGLPAGTYAVRYTSGAGVEGTHPDVTLAAGAVLSTSIPGAGVLSVIGTAGGGGGPAPVDCVETHGLWGPGAQPEGWSACQASGATGSRHRERTWTRTVAPQNGGNACTWSGADGTPGFERVNEACDVPAVDVCVTAPLVVRVTGWPGAAEGSRSLRYSATVAGVVVQMAELRHIWTAPQRLFVTDSRGCSVTVQR